MAICAQFFSNPNRLLFEKYPVAYINYQETPPEEVSSCISLNVINSSTQKTISVFLTMNDLRRAGISWVASVKSMKKSEELLGLLEHTSIIQGCLQRALPILSQHLDPLFLKFFQDIPYATRAITSNVSNQVERLSKIPGVPGIYFAYSDFSLDIFINLKKTPNLGKGTFSKVRKVLWLTSPNQVPEIVAKKVLLNNNNPSAQRQFQREVTALFQFLQKRGIISMISSGIFDSKFATFQPFYECNLYQYFNLFEPSVLTLNEKLSVIYQWLEGLATISQKGIHGDIKPENLLLRRGNQGIEAVIADFGAYQPYGQEEYGRTSPLFAPPEYHLQKKISSKQDVWGLGLCVHEMFTKEWLPIWDKVKTKKEIHSWVSGLKSNWILDEGPTSAPFFIIELIRRMLEPCPDCRISAKQAFESFAAGYAIYSKMR